MNKQHQKKFESLESSRGKLFDLLKDSTHQHLNAKPAPDKWSINQIISHLLTAETLSVEYIKKKIENASSVKRAGFKSKFRLWTLKVAFFLPLKYKAPPIAAEVPEISDLKELKEKWDVVRNDLYHILLNSDKSVLKKEIFKHLIVGKMNLQQALEFMQTHFDHHFRQIEKLSRSIDL
jgi:hypothetical protein